MNTNGHFVNCGSHIPCVGLSSEFSLSGVQYVVYRLKLNISLLKKTYER